MILLITLAVDETKLKVNGQHLFVWAAIDVDSREILAVDASWQRSTMNVVQNPEGADQTVLQQLSSEEERHKMRQALPRDIHILVQQPENTPNPK